MLKFPIKVFTENDFQIIENQQSFDELLKEFEFIRAAGGIVRNEKGEILMIFRRGKWDFPKGKVEAGEDNATAALREVREETGVTARITEGKAISIFHTYDTYGPKMLKETVWFPMRALSEQNLTPQTEEEIAQAVWIPAEKINELLQASYTSLQELGKLL